MTDPEKALNRSREYWQKQGRSEKWIQQRMMGQETGNKLTDYWKDHGVKENDEFAILTNIIHQEWSDLSVKDHKNLKGLKSQNLRDHMSEAEIIFTALAELSTRQIAENMQTDGLEQNKIPAKQGGKIAKDARKALEQKTGIKVNKMEVVRLGNNIVADAHFVTVGFLCEDFIGEPEVKEPDEITEWQWFELNQLPKPIFPPSQEILNNYFSKKFYSG